MSSTARRNVGAPSLRPSAPARSRKARSADVAGGLRERAPRPTPPRYRGGARDRLGGCRGVLKASAQGLAFEPEGSGSKDAFIFAYRDFVHDHDGDTLVLKTSDRTFRFQPIDINGKRNSDELSALLATLRAAR